MVCVEGWRCLNGRVWNLFFFKQKTADEMRISDWSSDVCSSDLIIKALDEHSHGFYAPSPGVIYPALTYLEEIGFTTVVAERSEERRVGKECAVRVELGGSRNIKKKNRLYYNAGIMVTQIGTLSLHVNMLRENNI